MVSFNNCCDVACLKFKLKFLCGKTTDYLRTIHFWGKTCNFHQMHELCISKVGLKWRHFSGVVDRFRITYVEFRQDSVYHKLFKSVYFWRRCSKNKKLWPVYGTHCIMPTLLLYSGVTKVFGDRGQKQWSAPPLRNALRPKVVTWLSRQQSDVRFNMYTTMVVLSCQPRTAMACV